MSRFNPEAKWVVIDPTTASRHIAALEKAEAEGVIIQRSRDSGKIDRYARAMTEHRWAKNGQAIQFTDDGVPLNGMHRLLACIEAKVPFETLAVYGVPLSAMTTIDTGKSRSAGDVLHMLSHKNGNELAAAVRWIHRLNSGYVSAAIDMDVEEIRRWLDNNPELEPMVAKAKQMLGRQRLLPAGPGAALFWLFSLKDEAMAVEFFDKMSTGVNLSDGDPIHGLRKRLLESRISTWKSKKIDVVESVAMTMRAWNAKRQGKTRQLIVGTRTDSDGRRMFPSIE